MEHEKPKYFIIVNGEKENLMNIDTLAENEAMAKSMSHKLQQALEFIKTMDIDVMLIAINSKNDEKVQKENITKKIEQEVLTVISNLCITPKLHGYYYLKEAIMMVVLSPEYVVQITKTLYPDIAKKYGTTEMGIERTIRTAIESSWKVCPDEMKQRYFEQTKRSRPTNAEFIATLAEYVKLKTAK